MRQPERSKIFTSACTKDFHNKTVIIEFYGELL